MIPNAFRINDGDRSVQADAQAVRLGAVNFRVGAGGESELLEAAFEKFPGRQPGIFGAAFGFGLVRAEEDVALDFLDAEGGGAGAEVVHGLSKYDFSRELQTPTREGRSFPP